MLVKRVLMDFDIDNTGVEAYLEELDVYGRKFDKDMLLTRRCPDVGIKTFTNSPRKIILLCNNGVPAVICLKKEILSIDVEGI